jgi:two-component system, cell cycle response regulator DivK
MAGESILIVDDTPVNLKLTRILLVNEGYKVLTAASAEEAVELLRSYHPILILADVQLPGMDGLELTRRVKQGASTRDILVVALTAFAGKGDEQKAIDAGCDGYITKPIDTRALGSRIRGILDRRNESPPPAAPPAAGTAQAQSIPGVDPAEMLVLRRRFLAEGQEKSRQLLLELDGQFNANDAAKAVHQWIGTGGLLGYTAISRLAREVEAVLLERPVDNFQLRDSLTNLALSFNSPREARDAPISEQIVKTLSNKRVAAVGLPTNEQQRLSVALARAQAVPVFMDLSDPPNSRAALDCQVAVIYVKPETATSRWLNPAFAVESRPIVFVGARDDLLGLDHATQSLAREFLMDAWQPEEALVRLSLALSPRPEGARGGSLSEASQGLNVPAANAAVGRPKILIADDDSTVLALVRTALQNFGMECHTAADGLEAIAAARRLKPQVAVLDVNMPGMDGFEVLAAIRAEEIPSRVVLLTARQQEADVIRGFTLGADDYVVKPFSPMELVARLKRLLSR